MFARVDQARIGSSISTEVNKALVRRFLQAQNEKDLAALREMMTPDFVDHNVLPGQGPTREDYLQGVAEDQAAFSDSHISIKDQIAEDDKVMTRLMIRGSHDQGTFTGMPPTGGKLEFTVITVNRVVGGKIAEEWSEGGGMYELAQQRLDQELRERERFEHELRVAQRIQQALLPKELPVLDDWEIFPYYQPAREVGGDFYDFLPLPDGRMGIIIGDVSGKGIAAALVMANTQSVLRAVFQGSATPGELLAQVNEVLFAYIPSNMFVTCFCGILDPESGRFTYANAGHNSPLRQHGGKAIDLRATGMPLGLMPGMAYEEKATSLLPGDRVLLYSDGLIEAHSEEREMLGSRRLKDLLTEHSPGAKHLTAYVLAQLARFTGEQWEQEDDITLVALQRRRARDQA
jgi:serine phosphatase RsbU (regulator of sigma subunit)/predicted ester cyclase